MKILCIGYAVPEYDKYAGDLRYFRLMKILAERNSVDFYCYNFSEPWYREQHPDRDRYVESLRKNHVAIQEGHFADVLRRGRYDVLFFEFYGSALLLLNEARTVLPSARIVVDSIDVHFRRLFAKATLTRKPEDLREAEHMKKKELAAYRPADVVVTVSELDRRCLLAEHSQMKVEVVPLIYADCQSLPQTTRAANSLLFVGNFNHEPNADAMRFFCGDILPLIINKNPHVKVTVVGSDPPSDLRTMASPQVQILGHVPDLTPYLKFSWVSIAPIRFGAGMNGKVGEAMAFGLPVVTTSVGAEGFGVKSGEELLIADTAAEFSDSVLRLFEDAALHARLASNGQDFIRRHFSEDALRASICKVFEHVLECKPKRASIRARFLRKFSFLSKLCFRFLPKIRYQFDRHIGWRLHRQ